MQRNGGCYGIEISATKGDCTDRQQTDAGDKGTANGTDTTCVSAGGAYFVCEKRSPTCLESPRGWHRQDQDLFPEHSG